MWSVYKELYSIADSAIRSQDDFSIQDLESALKLYKPEFFNILQNPAKSITDRKLVMDGNSKGLITESQTSPQILTPDFITEALTLSDLFDLNEVAAVDLLLSAENQMSYFPGLPRGLVAVLLYYDGKSSIINCLKMLLQAREGRMWVVPQMIPDLCDIITKFTSQVINQGLVSKILNMLKVYDCSSQLEMLQRPEFRAVGPPKHKEQITDKIKEINASLCNCLFYMSCQNGLPREETLLILGGLSRDSVEGFDSTLSDKTLSLLMSFLYAIDVRVLDHADSEAWMSRLPILNDKMFVKDIHREIMSEVAWSIPGLKSVVQFAWSITLHHLSIYVDLEELSSSTEDLMNYALDQDVFFFIKTSLITNNSFHEEEYYVRRIHNLITDFIVLMPLKVKELRIAGDESARIIVSRQQESLIIPPNLSKHYQHFMEFISDMYTKDPLNLELSTEFWCSEDLNQSLTSRAPQIPLRQVSLFKFIRLAGEMLLPPLYVPYINMLAGLANNSTSALHCFNLLKMNSTGSHTSIVSWDHFFMSLNQYYTNLHQETSNAQEPQQPHHAFGYHRNIITPQEIDGLRAVLNLITTVVDKNEEARVALSESGRCSPLSIIFGLIGCCVSPKLKADLLMALSAFAKTTEVSANMWQMIETSQIVYTIGSGGTIVPGGIHNELEEVESRNEEYPMTRALIHLINVLTLNPIPPLLGAGIRPPGFYPYLEFLRDAVFLKFNSRSYKRSSEKWEVCSETLEILCRLMESYEMNMEDFMEGNISVGSNIPLLKSPGHVLLMHLFCDSNLLKMILFIIDEAIKIYEKFLPIPDKEFLDKSSLMALKMIEIGLKKQDKFLEALRQSGSPVIGAGLDKLLLGVNPRSGKPDHLVNLARYIINNGSIPEHSLIAVNIYVLLSQSGYVRPKIVALLTGSEEFTREMMCGFAECLEYEDVEEDEVEKEQGKSMSPTQVRVQLREGIINLLLISLDHPAPNLTHLLCGFNTKKSLTKTSLQDPGVDGFPRTCLHSIVTVLSRGVDMHDGPACVQLFPTFSELAYQFIYSLSTNPLTYVAVLRYLRSHDFLFKQASKLPFAIKSKDSQDHLLHGSWLLKSIIVDLRVSALNKQRSYVQRIVELLLDEKTFKNTSNQSKLLRILDSVTFRMEHHLPALDVEIFDKTLIEQVIASCEVSKDKNLNLYDVKALYLYLVGECSGLTGPYAPQRERAFQEINSICANVVERNRYKKELYSKKQAFIAWRQAVEIILTSCPADLLAGEKRQLFIFELLQSLLHKLTADASPDLTSHVACVVLMLVCNLSQTFVGSHIDSIIPHPSCDFVSPDISMIVAKQEVSSSRSTFSTSLQVVLSSLLQYLLTAASLGQKVRIYLYGALLYFLEIAEKPVQLDIFISGPVTKNIEKHLTNKDNEYDKLSRENLATINKFAEPLLLCLCKDVCDGHDVAKMLAMGVLDKILSKDLQSVWVAEMSSKGYIQHIINSLVTDDAQLRNLLNPKPEPLRALFIFQSKISLLTRISRSSQGAYVLLALDLMSHLSRCTVLDLRPEPDYSSSDGFIPAVLTRYRQQVLFPVLQLCLSFLTSLGSDNIMAANKMFVFIMSHIDVFMNILNDKQFQHHTLESLRELQLTTALVAWTAQDIVVEQIMLLDAGYGDVKMCMNRLQRQMMQLLVRFNLSESRRKNFAVQVVKNLRSSNVVGGREEDGDDNDLISKVFITVEEIISNSLTLSRSLITKSTSQKSVPVLFGPSLSGGIEQNQMYGHSGGYDLPLSMSSTQPPCLGVVVQLLIDSSLHFLSNLEMHKSLMNRYNNLSDLTPAEVKELCDKEELNENLSLPQRNKLLASKLIQLLKYKSQEIRILSYIIENALLLLWRHLEFYLVVCQSGSSNVSLLRNKSVGDYGDVMGGFGSSKCLESELSREQLNKLKEECLTWIDDSLLRRLQDIDQNYGQSKSKFGFVSSLVRRIQRMLTFNTILK